MCSGDRAGARRLQGACQTRHGVHACGEYSAASTVWLVLATLTLRLYLPLSRLQVHVLDLHPEGYILPHVDSIKFSGGVVAGLSLLSTSIMRLQVGIHRGLDIGG
jgi:hypothetical protein